VRLATRARMSRPPRLQGFHYIGSFQYFLTLCALGRRPAFRDHDLATLVIEQFRRTASEMQFAFLAYCVMPDHVHLLIEGMSAASDLQRFVKRAKQRTGQMHSQRAGVRLWQEGYYDRVLRRDEDARIFARYILENPVRAGLTDAPQQYPYLGSDVWSVEELLRKVL
jgi:REP element-mobilizing transposase RayT